MGVAQSQITARVNGVMDPQFGYGWYDINGNYTSDYNQSQVDNANRQRRQAANEQRGQAQAQALQIIGSISETRPKIRAEMTNKYKVEF
jgi:hypothetical protein